MIYIPMLKTRKEEYDVLSNMKDCFSEKIIPLVEIISEFYKISYKTDPVTGVYIYKETEKRRMKIKEKPTDKDCITLSYISDILDGKRAFIDYFRFSNKVYGNNVDILKVELSWRLSNDVELYKSKVKEITVYPNMIPVVSIKDGFGMTKNELIAFIVELQNKCDAVALRITEKWIQEYSDIIKTQMRRQDYLLLDLLEQAPEHKFMEIKQIKDMKSNTNIVLLNSPRKRETRNSDFPEHEVTDLINNSARKVAEKNNLHGYGDYCGLKDAMPLKGGGRGLGAALALFYDFNSNAFYSYANHDTKLGVRGYADIVPQILEERNILDPHNDCPGYKKIDAMKGFGNWGTWHNINATRYIYQTYKYL